MEKIPNPNPSQLCVVTLSLKRIIESEVQTTITPIFMIGKISEELNNLLFSDFMKYSRVI